MLQHHGRVLSNFGFIVIFLFSLFGARPAIAARNTPPRSGNTRYYWRVRAFNTRGDSSSWAGSSFRTPAQ